MYLRTKKVSLLVVTSWGRSKALSKSGITAQAVGEVMNALVDTTGYECSRSMVSFNSF
jgi:hypothetical protein